MQDHERNLASAFDGQAAQFEVAAVQSNPAALARLLEIANLPAGGRVLDAGCGPGLVSEVLLQAGYQVLRRRSLRGDDRPCPQALRRFGAGIV